MKSLIKLGGTFMLIAVLASCTWTRQDTGMVAGGVVGGVVGNAVTGGSAVGTGVGAVGGAVVGSHLAQ